MQHHLADDIQLVLLFDDASSFDRHFAAMTHLIDRLQRALHDMTATDQLRGLATDSFGGLMQAQGRFHCTVARYDAPMAQDGFLSVVTNPFIANSKPELVRAVADHQRALLVTIGAGSAPGFAKALAETGLAASLGPTDLGIDLSQKAFEERLLVAQLVGKLIVTEQMPSAIHWVQSQQLLDGPGFVALANEGFCLPLYVGPYIYGTSEMLDGSVSAGVRGLGSQHLIGKMVIFRPCPDPWTDSYRMILTFVAYCRSIGRILGPDETISLDGDGAKVVRVAHKNDIPQLPDGYVELHLDPFTPVAAIGPATVTADVRAFQDATSGRRNGLSPGGGGQPVLHPADVQTIGAAPGVGARSPDTDWIKTEVRKSSLHRGGLAGWLRSLIWRGAFACVILGVGYIATNSGLIERIVLSGTAFELGREIQRGDGADAPACRLPPPAKCETVR